jgi:hypothetical protein
MKKLIPILLVALALIPTHNGLAQFPAGLDLVPISSSATKVEFKAVMKPLATIMNIEAVSVAVTYDPALFNVDSLTSITNKYFSNKGFDDASNAVWNANNTNPDIMLYTEYHPTFGSVPILKNAPPDLCTFTLYPKSAPITASFCVWMNVPTGALTYYFESGVAGTKNFDPVTCIVDWIIPVELTAFTAAQQGEGITLRWVTASETNNFGFHVQRRDVDDATQLDWETIGFVEGAGNTAAERQYLYFDWTMPKDGTYLYRLKQQDFDGTITYSPEAVVQYQLRPYQFALRQNYPNPISLSAGNGTMIGYDVAEGSQIHMTICNMLGQEVTTLVDDFRDAGAYTVNWAPAGISAGTYVVTLRAETASAGTSEIMHMQMQVVR